MYGRTVLATSYWTSVTYPFEELHWIALFSLLIQNRLSRRKRIMTVGRICVARFTSNWRCLKSWSMQTRPGRSPAWCSRKLLSPVDFGWHALVKPKTMVNIGIRLMLRWLPRAFAVWHKRPSVSDGYHFIARSSLPAGVSYMLKQLLTATWISCKCHLFSYHNPPVFNALNSCYYPTL